MVRKYIHRCYFLYPNNKMGKSEVNPHVFQLHCVFNVCKKYALLTINC